MGISEEEESLFSSNASSRDIDKYIAARNLILSAWRRSVHKQLSLADALALLPPALTTYGEVAWAFLATLGFINFTVLPGARSHSALARVPDAGMEGCDGAASEQPAGSVIVIGAGLAGLAAARQLLRFGYKVVVVEAQDRPGGRVHTMRLEGAGHEAVGDLGGAVITGIDGNPLAVLARQLDIPMYHIASDSNDDCPLYLEHGALVNRDTDAKASEAWGLAEHASLAISEQYSADAAEVISLGTFIKVKLADKLEVGNPQRSVLRWMYANTEFSAAALATELSALRWADDDKFEFSGAHVWLPGGNARLVKALAEDAPIFYQTPVQEVHYGSEGCTVVTDSRLALSADAVVVTVPLGVLKANDIRFHPPLPSSKQRVIERFGFGVLNKVVLLFPSRWWDPTLDTFGHIVPDDQEPGLLYLWYCVADVAGGPLLAALVAGQAALDVEAMTDGDVMRLVMARLRAFHPAADVPDPVASVVTRWGSDPYTRGSYSSVPPGCNGTADYRELAANVDGRVFFAGEATTFKYPAQMHGAFESGLREAAKVHAALSLGRARKPADALQEERVESENPAAMERQARLALMLQAEFRAGADVEAGCCAAVHAAFAQGRASEWAILQVVMELAEFESDSDRFQYLARCNPPVRLHNRKALSVEQMTIMEEVLTARNGSLPALEQLLQNELICGAAARILLEQQQSDGVQAVT